ncbi:GNAT family N-acetyltransferase [Microbacterium sp. CPCC 204701]|uniref:GNAT family N-acetyltransferase n=1 Tax=Microbacterium sp. CPCC 204701 TaxID=2493084 RepID=UPI000FDCC817|nr:GNAT family N-acetyltransferase [Microbacterium sp. CPCC 204701]
MTTAPVRRASADDAGVVAQLLHDFNTEFDSETPGPAVLRERLTRLLAGPATFALLGGEPPAGLALVTLRPNVWYPGAVALLDELYVAPGSRGSGIGGAIVDRLVEECGESGVSAIEVNVDEGDVDALRFYDRHGFHLVQPDTGERAFYLSRELG